LTWNLDDLLFGQHGTNNNVKNRKNNRKIKEEQNMMDLIRWNPLHEALSLQDKMNQLFGGSLLRRGEDWAEVWNPAVDVFEDQDKLVVKAELPGIDKDDIRVDVQNGMLMITAERRSENEEKDGRTFYRREMSYGKFVRSFSLPQDVAADSVKAEHTNGVLTVEVPKPEARKPKQIKVN
jgi:HSP20 family protein